MSEKLHPDFLIISALQIEHSAVLECMIPHGPVGEFQGVYVSLKEMADSPMGVALPITEAGRLDSAVLTAMALALWRPQVTLLVGLAGGFESAGVSMEDVIVATDILDFELQKITLRGPEVRWRSFSPSKTLVDSAVETAKRDWAPKRKATKVHFGPMLSGEKIVASSSFSEILQSWRRDALGIEMEGAGVATASKHAGTHFMMIRGVADFSNESKSDLHQRASCESAAEFSAAVLNDWFNTHGKSRSIL